MIEHVNKKIYFRDIYLFIKRIKDLIIIKSLLIRENL